jgi:hypothetical protein
MLRRPPTLSLPRSLKPHIALPTTSRPIHIGFRKMANLPTTYNGPPTLLPSLQKNPR